VNPAELNAYDQNAFHLLCDAVCDYSECIPLFMNLPNAEQLCNVLDETGKSPVVRTVLNSNVDHLRALLEYPFVDLNLTTDNGRTASQWASVMGNSEALNLLESYKN
jgi:ankyrin repeat protein